MAVSDQLKQYNRDFYNAHKVWQRHYQLIADVLSELKRPNSAIDFGCGNGYILQEFSKRGIDVLGIDGAGDSDSTKLFPFLQSSLTSPIDLNRQFDLVISTEVAEHLPASAADAFVETLTRHGDCIFFSAAQPGQEGKGHINCQQKEYWQRKFQALGYMNQTSLEKLLSVALYPITMDLGWIRKNMQVFARSETRFNHLIWFHFPKYVLVALYYYVWFRLRKRK